MTAQAQFIEKLKNRTKRAFEETVIRKAEQKVVEETDKAFEKNEDKISQRKSSKVDPSKLQGTYHYDWRYSLQMQRQKSSIQLDYHLRNEGTDYASIVEMEGKAIMEGTLMLMDESAGITAILMEQSGNKIGQLMDSLSDEMMETSEDENPMKDAEFTEIGTKEILGYECQGFQIENDEITMIMYLAFDTPVSFNKIYGGPSNNQLPKGFDKKWLDKIGSNSLMMEMDLVHKDKPKESSKIICVALEKEKLDIDLSGYTFY